MGSKSVSPSTQADAHLCWSSTKSTLRHPPRHIYDTGTKILFCVTKPELGNEVIDFL
ncbi:MAG: hypothetical protein HY959_06230 [Ignavibacteriae bacterium]|nr:hypothetical protein [Ignavibacteriota bacterium]